MDSNHLDLPATQPQGVLSPYQQGVPMGPAPEEDPSGGTFSLIGLVHSVRRQFLPAFLAGICLATLLAGLLWFAIPVTYTAEAYLKVDRELFQGTSQDYMIFKETQGALLSSTFVVQRALADTEIQQLSIVKYDQFGRQREHPARWLAGAVNVQVDEDELLYVTMKGRNLKQTEQVLKGVLDAYKSEVVSKERMEKVEELSQYRKAYQKTYEQIEKASDDIQGLAEKVGGLESETIRREQVIKLEELRQSQNEVERLTRSLMEAMTKVEMLKTESQVVRMNAPSELMIMDEMSRDPAYYELGLQIENMKDSVQLYADQLPPDSPQMSQLTEQIGFYESKRKRMAAELRPRIIERLKNKSGVSTQDITRDLALQTTLQGNLQKQLALAKKVYDEKREEMASFGKGSGELIARVQAKEALMKDLLKIQETKTDLEMEMQGRARVQVIQDPYVSNPSTLISKMIQIAGGWCFAFVGVMAAISYWDYLGQKVNGSEDMSKTNRVIGSLPAIQGFKGDVKEPMRIAADAARTAIIYNRQIPAQCVMVTSATGEEGRSTVASQLAISMTRAGKTTLLVDADLRNPQQHTAFQLQPRGGLGEMLRGELAADEAIDPTSVENLWLLSAGRFDQIAVRGLGGERASQIFEDLRARFDAIVIDSSPVLTSPDALLIGQQADAAVLSVRRDISQVPKVNAASEQLTSVGIPILGSILNGGRVERRTGAAMEVAEEVTHEEQPAIATA